MLDSFFFFSSSSDCETCDISSDSQAIQSERGVMASGSKFTWSTFSKEDPILCFLSAFGQMRLAGQA